ncbi:Ankyrin repeat protein [compost metagenome]
MFAAMFGRNEVLSLLIENGADLTLADLRGQTALDYAALQGNEPGAKILTAASGALIR